VVLEAAKNGYWKTNSRPKTVAKRILKKWLPIGLFVQYSLDPERLLDIKVGSDASEAAVAAGIQVDPEAVRKLFKIA